QANDRPPPLGRVQGLAPCEAVQEQQVGYATRESRCVEDRRAAALFHPDKVEPLQVEMVYHSF
ncbi:MAG: hypothetical protein ACUVXB_17590, partial [Bryobacteraceae bacterium]